MLQANTSLADFFDFPQLINIIDEPDTFNPYDDNPLAPCGCCSPGYGDVSIILSGSALLSQHLYHLLRANLVGDEEEIERLASYQRIQRSLAHCLGLIDYQQFKDLECISRIRNRAAHDCPLPTLYQEDIWYLLRQIRGYKKAMVDRLDHRAFFMQVVCRLAQELNEALRETTGKGL